MAGRARLVITTLTAAAAALAIAAPAGAAVIKVTSTEDDYATKSGCSLREAIWSANTDTAFEDCTLGSGRDEIRLVDGSVYNRAIDGLEEDNALTGDLDITSTMTIGPKKGRATISAGGYDRVFDVLGEADLKLSRVTVTGALETYPPDQISGAGVRVGGKLTTDRTRIVGNKSLGNGATNGGGLVMYGDASVKLDRTTISGNEAGNVGGGISMYEGTLKIRRSTIAGNTSGSVGGGLYLGGDTLAPGDVQVKDSTISGNGAGGNGGGVYIANYATDDDPYRLVNSTISGNSTTGSGGGLYVYVGSADLGSVTVTGNEADTDTDGGFDHSGGISGPSIAVENSIVYGNIDLNPTDPVDDCQGGNSDGGNVLGEGCSATKRDTGEDPKLKRLRDNGGPTSTHAIRKGSAVGQANRKTSPRKDQRGKKRDRQPDAGSYERR